MPARAACPPPGWDEAALERLRAAKFELADPAARSALERGLHDGAYWSAWLATLASPAPLPNWGEAFKTQAGLARRHNTQAFVQVLYVMVREGANDGVRQRLVPGLLAALKALP